MEERESVSKKKLVAIQSKQSDFEIEESFEEVPDYQNSVISESEEVLESLSGYREEDLISEMEVDFSKYSKLG